MTANTIDLSSPGDGCPGDGLFWALRSARIGHSTISYSVGAMQYAGTVKIHSLRTPPAERGHGSARIAMTTFLDTCDAKGLRTVFDASALDRRTHSARLIGFYRSLGYELTGRTINAVLGQEMSRPPGGIATSDRLSQSSAKSCECIYEIEVTGAGQSTATLYVSRGMVLFCVGGNRAVVEGQRLTDATPRVGDEVGVNGLDRAGQTTTACTVMSVREIIRVLPYNDWLVEVDRLAWEQCSERDYTDQTGANRPGDTWVESYLDGVTPEGAWQQEIASAGV